MSGSCFKRSICFHHLTAARNVTLGLTVGKRLKATEAAEICREVLAEVELADKADAYPARLSGGQQQHVAIARALAMKPVLLLFDEITSALDPELTSEVVRVLERLAAKGQTKILVTHEMGFARRAASKLIFMHQGKLWEQGRPDDLFEDPMTKELAAFLSVVQRD